MRFYNRKRKFKFSHHCIIYIFFAFLRCEHFNILVLRMMRKMNYATIKKFDIANGPGVRVSLFVSGCRHHCKNCFNKEAWDFNYGNPMTEAVEEEISTQLKKIGVYKSNRDGGESMTWRVADYGSFLVHIMTQEARDFYALDKIFSFGSEIKYQKPKTVKKTAKKATAKKTVAKKTVKKTATKKTTVKKSVKTATKKTTKKATVKKTTKTAAKKTTKKTTKKAAK